MKKRHLLLAMSFMSLTSVSLSGTSYFAENDSTGLPGDHFSLEGALDLFKKSSSLEDFEKQLNAESNNVNNLDLNGDGEIDYVRVSDKMEGTAHAIILQTAVTESESQDVAVIEVEKTGEKSAVLQIIGDDELYNQNTIVEPFDEQEVKTGKGPAINELVTKRLIVNVWFWPCVTFIYAPVYVPWVSPWHWHYYPVWWKPWHQHPWYFHYKNCAPYRSHHHIVYVNRTVAAHKLYSPYRKTSVVVATRYKAVHENHAARKPAMETKSVRGNEGKKSSPKNQGEKPHRGNKVDKPHPANQGGGGRKQGGKPPGAGGKGGKKR